MTFSFPSVVSGLTESMAQLGKAVTGRRSNSKYFFPSKGTEIQELKNELHSKSKEKKKEAIKKVIAAMTVGKDVLELYPDIVNCLQTSNIELKRLIYLYIINYAKLQPELAILAINTFRKDCLDSNPLIRALAVRTMGCLQLTQVEEYLIEPLRKACKDGDPYVRKTAAACICKIYDTSPDVVKEENFIQVLQEMLHDTNPSVVSNALASLTEISEISGKNCLKLNNATVCRLLNMLNDASEWGQVFVLDALAGFQTTDEAFAKSCIEKIQARLSHTNPSVVMSSIRVILQLIRVCNDMEFVQCIHQVITPPLISLLSREPEIQYIVLRNILFIVQKYPTLLKNHIKTFFCKYNDPPYVKFEKIDILLSLATEETIDQILQEFSEYASDMDTEFVRLIVRATGQCAIKVRTAASKCIGTLLNILKSGQNHIIQETFIAMKDILRTYPHMYTTTLPSLCDSIQLVDEPESKAAVIWIIGEYAEHIDNALELIHFFLETFEAESSIVCQQVLTSSVKLFLKKPKESQDLVTRVLSLCTEKANDPDLRDRGYIYWRLLATNPEAAKTVVLQPKSSIQFNDVSFDPVFLNVLIDNISTLASIFHCSPKAFHCKSKETNIEITDTFLDDKCSLLQLEPSRKGTRTENDDCLLSLSRSISDSNLSNQSSTSFTRLSNDVFNQNKSECKDFQPLQELLSTTTPGNNGKTGLQVLGKITLTPQESIMLHVSIHNAASPHTLESEAWAIQIKTNPFGICAKNSTDLKIPNLRPGEQYETDIPLLSNVDNCKNDEALSFVLQIAFKTSLDIFYLKPVPLPPQAVLCHSYTIENMDKILFEKQWNQFTYEEHFSLSHKHSTDLSDILNLLEREKNVKLLIEKDMLYQDAVALAVETVTDVVVLGKITSTMQSTTLVCRCGVPYWNQCLYQYLLSII